jgi:solute carrier family 25 folate transporter 32
LRTRLSLIVLPKEESLNFIERTKLSYLLVRESILKEGFFKLYKGIMPSFFLAFYGGFQMTIYQTSKNFIIKKDKEFKKWHGSLIGIFSRIFTSFILYPFNLIRSKQQQLSETNQKLKLDQNLVSRSLLSKNEHSLFYNSVKLIYSQNGIRTFYNGISPMLMRQVPGSSLFFYTYEYMLKLFQI